MMKKFFTRFLAALALLVFMTPSLAGWGQTRSTTTFSYSAYSGQGTSGTGSACNATQNGVTIASTKAYGSSSDGHVREYSTSTITISGPTITKIEITCTASGTSNYGPSKLGLASGYSGSYSYSGYVGTWSAATNADPVTEVKLNANAQCRWTQIVVTYTSSDPEITVDGTLTVTPAAVTDGELSVTYANITPTHGTITLFDAQDNDITSSCTWFTPSFNTDLSKVIYTATENTTGAVNALRMHLAVTDGNKNATADVAVSQDFILTTMDQVLARATANGSTEKDVTIRFNNWVISDVNNSEYQYATKAWLTDGTKGCVISCTSPSYAKFKVNDKLNGTVNCKLKLYTGYAQISSLISGNDGTTATSGLTVTNDGTVNPVTGTTIAGLSAVNTGSVVTLTGLICQSESYNVSTGYILSDGTNTIRVKKNTYSGFELTQNSTYSVTGVFEYYSSNKYIYPRSSADINEVTSPVITVESSLSSFTYCEGEGPSAAQTITVSGSNLEGNIILALNDGNESAFEISLNENNNYSNTLTLQQANGTVGETTIYVRMKAGLAKLAGGYADEINLTSSNATPKTVNLTGTVTPPMITWDLTTGTYVTNPAPTTDLIQWSSNYVTMKNEKNGGTNVNNYLGGTGTNADTRMYNKNILTFTPANGYAIDSVVLTTTSSSYINGLNNTKWKNATISVSNNIATAKPTNGNNPIIDTISATIRLTAVTVYYSESTATNYAISIDDEMTHGTIVADKVKATEGATVTLTVYPEAGYYLEDNNIMVDVSGVNLTKINAGQFTFAMPAEDVTIYADFSVYSGTYYTLVNNTADLIPGRHYIIASSKTAGVAYAMGAQNSGYRERVAVNVVGNFIYGQPTGLHEVVLSGDNTNYWTLYDDGTAASSKGYLYASSTSANNIGTRADNVTTNPERGQWAINITEGVASIVSQIGDDKPNTIKNNETNNRFSCYTSTSTQLPVYLYMRANETDFDFYSNTTVNNLTIGGLDIYTVHSPSVLKVTGTLSNQGDHENLIIEDGGQLISNNAVQATIRRSITGYGSKGDNNGWYFIATPVAEGTTPSEDNGVLAGSYDLYYYNEPTHYWFNYESHDGGDPGFTQDGGKLLNGKGYLYANTVNADLSFEGATVPANAEVEIPLSYTTSLTPEGLRGFNLVGNPFTYNLTEDSDIKLGEVEFATYYRIEEGAGITSTTISDTPIQPGVGFMVQATGTGQNLVFNPSAKGRAVTKPSYIRIMAGNDSFMDHAYIQFGNFNTLRKYVLNDETPQVYVMNEGLDWAATILDEPVGEMPVNFKAGKNGTYTINVKPENVEVTYLHLIDNLTGANVDLLANPSYSFEANKGDNANRFRLVFKTNADVEENTATETFAYYNGSEWVINGTGDATLQVIDMMGRVLRSEQINGNTAINLNQAAGIYMLRLVNGENVMVQKVVVR